MNLSPAVARSCWMCGDVGTKGHCCAELGGLMQLPCVVCQPGAQMRCSCPPPQRNPHIVRLQVQRHAALWGLIFAFYDGLGN